MTRELWQNETPIDFIISEAMTGHWNKLGNKNTWLTSNERQLLINKYGLAACTRVETATISYPPDWRPPGYPPKETQ